MKIGEVASSAHCSVETVRFYEKQGLLPAPLRTAANYRSYTPLHVERLRFIRHCRVLNMTHGEIRQLLDLVEQPAADCGAVNHLLEDHITHVETRIAELIQLKGQLTELRRRCRREQRVDACGIVQGIAAMDTGPAPERHTHLG
ncbi:Cd(II)/Pb(II)-responsive transcriptional regulator [Acerihabitans sp.]|uniref:Cd(II)/Pb(II)-responsive transcriptional regulator n=1 Tax=Acerihabitans sp. TaxID=2811394 RepID=UPI002EDB18F8